MHLRQPGFTYSSCGLFTRNKQRIWKFVQAGYTNYIYNNELNKACFRHDMPYDKRKDLERRSQSVSIKRQSYWIENNPKYGAYQRGVASVVY